MGTIAVIADPHFHDTTNRQGSHRGPLAAVRTLADTMESTRVFNESGPALRVLLDDIVSRGIEIVVVAGDLSDDGQLSTVAAAAALLRSYSERHGLRFFATPGNHDLYAVHGRHHGKRYLNGDGSDTLVTSDPAASGGSSAASIVSRDMRCGGYAATLGAMAPFGFFRRPDFLHWESPFGEDDALGSRSFEVVSADGLTKRRILDASYLVEPVDGLWLLSIDANVFEPRNGDVDPTEEAGWIDSTDAGWNSMLRNKPFILSWMADVAQRARCLGKKLLAFSHYPAVDPLGGTAAEESMLLGDTVFLRRTPSRKAAEAVAATGIKVHFSGHLHINDTALFRSGGRFLVNVAVPSIVGFPAAYKIVHLTDAEMRMRTVTIAEVPGFDEAFGLYRAEAARFSRSAGDLLGSRNHVEFLSRHLGTLVTHRYLPKEWPQDLARLVPMLTLADLWRIADPGTLPGPGDAAPGADAASAPAGLDGIGLLDLVVDWYRLRNGRELALDHVPPERLAVYRAISGRYAAGNFPPGSLQARLASLFSILEAYLASQPSRDFGIDLGTGTIIDEAAYSRGLTDLRQTSVA